MILSHLDKHNPKGWSVGPWNSKVTIPFGYANQGVNEKHFHKQMHEVYLIASGTSTAVVNGAKVHLTKGDIFVVEPGEIHTFIENSTDYLHFVAHCPFVKDDKFIAE